MIWEYSAEQGGGSVVGRSVEVAGVLAADGDLSAGGARVVRRVGREVVLAVEGLAQDEAAPVVHVAGQLDGLLLLPAVVPARRHAVQEPGGEHLGCTTLHDQYASKETR